MGEPTATLTIEDLIIRVAREAGIAYHGLGGQEKAMVPIDPHDLDLVRDIVNDGIRTFIKSAPRNGWRWMKRRLEVAVSSSRVTGTVDSATTTTLVDTSLAETFDIDDDLNDRWIYCTDGTGEGSYAQVTDYDATGTPGTVTVAEWLTIGGNSGGTTPAATDSYAITTIETIEGDIHRYPLPENFYGTVDGRITYVANTNHSPIIDWVDEAFIRERRSVTVITGYPLYAAIVPYEPRASGAGPSRRFEIQFDPQPSGDDTFVFPYSLAFDKIRFEAGSATGGSATTIVDDTLANLYPDDWFNGWVQRVISGTGKNSTAVVTGYTGSTGTFTVADWLFDDGTANSVDPDNTSIYTVQPLRNEHPAGFRFDDAIKSACMAEAETYIDELANRGFFRKWKDIDLPDAKSIDARSAPRSVGTMNKVTGGPRRPIRGGTTWNDVTFN